MFRSMLDLTGCLILTLMVVEAFFTVSWGNQEGVGSINPPTTLKLHPEAPLH